MLDQIYECIYSGVSHTNIAHAEICVKVTRPIQTPLCLIGVGEFRLCIIWRGDLG